jgi:hypothetical protein
VDVPYYHIAMPAIMTPSAACERRSKRRPGGGLLRKPSKGRTILLRDSNRAVESFVWRSG